VTSSTNEWTEKFVKWKNNSILFAFTVSSLKSGFRSCFDPLSCYWSFHSYTLKNAGLF